MAGAWGARSGLSRCAFVFVDQSTKDVAAAELPGDHRLRLAIAF
jgi:hypothetical protein